MANIVELRNMSTAEIEELLDDARTEQFNLRFQRATGSLENTARLKQVRREIARLLEILTKRAWAIEELAKQPAVAAVLDGKEWTGEARYDYRDGYFLVTLSDADENELASGKVDLNKKRRRTRRQRSNILPIQKVDEFEVAS